MEIIIKCSDECRGGKNIYGEPLTEVVRCKECKWYYVINPKVERGLCEFEARPRSRKARSDSDFCSYGERGEE